MVRGVGSSEAAARCVVAVPLPLCAAATTPRTNAIAAPPAHILAPIFIRLAYRTLICDTIIAIPPRAMTFTPSSIAALIVATTFAAGLNVYATVATLGLLARFQYVQLPPGLDSLSHTWIIAVAALLFAVEFFADKIPALDVLWNAAHTFIRVPVAALLAYKASSQLSPEMQLLATAAGAAIAALAHTSKTAARILVTPSPEPASNIALSGAEDVAAISLTALATHFPFVAAGIAGTAIILLLLSLHWISTRLRRMWQNRPQWLRAD